MPEPEFDQVYEGFEDIAQKVFLHDGHHSFIIAVCEAGNLETFQLQFDSSTAKQRQFGLLERRYRGNAEFYVQVSEAWMTVFSSALDDILGQLKPSLHPDRIEVLEVCGAHRDGRRRLTTWKILRDPLRLERMDTEGVRGEGIWDKLLLGAEIAKLRYDDSGRMRLP